MSWKLSALVAAIVAIAAPAHGQPLKPYSKDPRVLQAAALLIDISHCPTVQSLESLVERKLADWLRHLGRGDNSLTCSRLPSASECAKKDKAASGDYYADMKFHYFDGLYGATKRPAPDCAALTTRVKGMKLLQPDWQPRDGLK